MKKIANIYNRLEEILLVIALAIMVVVVFVQVIMRFVFNNSLVWSEELARIIFVWMSWLGMSYGEKKGEHIKITMITDRLKGNVRKVVLIIADICTLVILGVFCYEGIIVVNKIMMIGSKAASLPIPNWMIYLSVPFSCLMMGIRIGRELILTAMGKDIKEVA